MAGPIQRYPIGFLEALAVKGLPAPNGLAESLVPTIDMLQFYGGQRTILLGGAGAAVQGSSTSTTAVPANTWALAFWAQAVVTKQAAMTQLAAGLRIDRGGLPVANGSFILASAEAVRFGGTGFFAVSWVAPYPVLLPPGSSFNIFLAELIGVANAVVSVQAEIGLLP